MFKREVKSLDEVMGGFLRHEGLEGPLQQRRLIEELDKALGPVAARHISDKYIRNQTLFVRMDSPVMRAELSMRRSSLIQKLNASVGGLIITDIRFC